MDVAVQVEGLTKRFPRTLALNDVTLDIPKGSLFGLLGPNGAGKTTLFSVAAGFLRPTAGSVRVLDVDVSEISLLRGRFSMLPQDAAFQGGIPVIDQLLMFGRLNGYDLDEARERAKRALEIVGLGEVAKRNARTLSHGMMKRVTLCQAFLGEPDVIFLDEPTSGLDPENARQMRELISSFREQRTVVVSSHNLQEIQDICDHVAILNEGVLEICGSMEDLTSSGILVRITLGEPLPWDVETALIEIPAVEEIEKTSPTDFNVKLDLRGGGDKDEALKLIQQTLAKHDIYPRSLFEGASLEARFLEITGGTYDGASAT